MKKKILHLQNVIITRNDIANAERVLTEYGTNGDDERWFIQGIGYSFGIELYPDGIKCEKSLSQSNETICLSDITITYDNIQDADEVLACNGILSTEVLQAIGYALFDAALYPDKAEYDTLWSLPNNNCTDCTHDDSSHDNDDEDPFAYENYCFEQDLKQERILRERDIWLTSYL